MSTPAGKDLPVADLVADSPQIAVTGPKKDRTHWLYISVIIAIIAGVAVGLLAPETGTDLKVLGTMFIQLIKMIIAPVIFCTIVLGIGSVRSAATVGKAGGIALAYFITMSTFALGVGLIVGNIIEPGDGLNIEPAAAGGAAHTNSAIAMIQHIIPESFFSAFTGYAVGEDVTMKVDVLQVLFIAVLVGFATQALGKDGEPILRFVAALQKLIFKILNWILWLAPIGAFGAMAGVVGQTGLDAVIQLGILILAFYLTCIIFIFGVLGVVLKIFTGQSIFKLCRYLSREFLLIFATSSSESALPNLMRKMEHLGVHKSTVGIVVPTGYSFNLDGTAIYLTMAAIFISDAMSMPMELGEQIGLLLFMMVASKGAAGVSGAGIATLTAGLQVHRPDLVDGVGILVGIDKFMSEARALTNFAGNSVATLLVGTWTKTVDKEQVVRVLNGQDPYIETELDDGHGSFRSDPTVVDPAHERLQPTPQINVDAYTER